MASISREKILPVIVNLLQHHEDCISDTDPELLSAGRSQMSQYNLEVNQPHTLYCNNKAWDLTLRIQDTTECDCVITWEVKAPGEEINTKSHFKVEAVVVNKDTGHTFVQEVNDKVSLKGLRGGHKLEIENLEPGSCNHVTLRIVQRFRVHDTDWCCVLVSKKISVILKQSGRASRRHDDRYARETGGTVPDWDYTMEQIRNLSQGMMDLHLDPAEAGSEEQYRPWYTGYQPHVEHPSHQGISRPFRGEQTRPQMTSWHHDMHQGGYGYHNDGWSTVAAPHPEYNQHDNYYNYQPVLQRSVGAFRNKASGFDDMQLHRNSIVQNKDGLYDVSGRWSVNVNIKRITDEGFQVCWDINKDTFKENARGFNIEVMVLKTDSKAILTFKPPPLPSSKLTVKNLVSDKMYVVRVLVMGTVTLPDSCLSLVLAQCSKTVETLPEQTLMIGSSNGNVCATESEDDLELPSDTPTVYNKFKPQGYRELPYRYFQQLHQKACSVLTNNRMTGIKYLYRNKPFPYFKQIISKFGGDMIPYTKDHNGDPRSPINGRLKGLFFSGAADDRGNLPASSPFGDTRFIVPVQRLFNGYTNLYFADFYCNNRDHHPHYVTLVLAQPGSSADHFCRSLQLLPLDRYRNPYFFLDPGTGEVRITTKRVWIELLYTETINVLHEVKHCGADWQFKVPTIGNGSSSPRGIPKNSDCTVCNV